MASSAFLSCLVSLKLVLFECVCKRHGRRKMLPALSVANFVRYIGVSFHDSARGISFPAGRNLLLRRDLFARVVRNRARSFGLQGKTVISAIGSGAGNTPAPACALSGEGAARGILRSLV